MAKYGPLTNAEGGGYNMPDAGTGLDAASSKGQVTQNAEFGKKLEEMGSDGELGGLYDNREGRDNESMPYTKTSTANTGDAGLMQGEAHPHRSKLTTNEAKKGDGQVVNVNGAGAPRY